MMASANVELVRSIYADLERGDFGRVFQTASEWAHPEIEWIIADGPTAGGFTGRAGMEESAYGMLGAWDDFRIKAEEYRELDDERVLVLDHRSARGTTSGLEVGTKGASLGHFRDGKVTRLVMYWEREHAFADLGLSAEGYAADSAN